MLPSTPQLLIPTQRIVAGTPSGVSIDAIGTKKYKSASTSFSDATVITVGAGNALIVTVAFGYAAVAPTSVSATWNGTSMTSVIHFDSATVPASTYIFGLRSPAAGAHTLALAWTNSAEIFVDAVSFSSVNVTNDGTAFPHTATLEIGGSSAATVTSAAGNYVVASESPSSGAATLTGTALFLDGSSGSFINAAANYDVGASTVNIGIVSGQTIIAAVDVAH